MGEGGGRSLEVGATGFTAEGRVTDMRLAPCVYLNPHGGQHLKFKVVCSFKFSPGLARIRYAFRKDSAEVSGWFLCTSQRVEDWLVRIYDACTKWTDGYISFIRLGTNVYSRLGTRYEKEYRVRKFWMFNIPGLSGTVFCNTSQSLHNSIFSHHHEEVILCDYFPNYAHKAYGLRTAK